MRILTAAAISAICLATPASAAQIATYKIASWDVGVYTNDQTRRFSHCAASGRYQSGITLLFSVSHSLEWAIGFSSPQWNLRTGRTFDVDFRIDGGRPHTVRGRAVSDRLIRATLPDSAALFNQFRYGLRMVVSVNDNPDVAFNLSNTNAMLTEILNCARKYRGFVDNERNRPREQDRDDSPRDDGPRNDDRPRRDDPPRNDGPRIEERDTGRRGDNRTAPPERNDGIGSSGSFTNQSPSRIARRPDREAPIPERSPERAPAPPVDAPGLGPTPDTRAEATQIATDILRRANFSFTFEKPESLARDVRERQDAVWRSEEFTGTLRIVTNARAENVEKIRADVIAFDQAACKGKFDSGALPAADSRSVTMFTSCKGAEERATYYILLPRRRGGVYLLGINGNGEAAARVQNVASAYRTVALEVIEQ